MLLANLLAGATDVDEIDTFKDKGVESEMLNLKNKVNIKYTLKINLIR